MTIAFGHRFSDEPDPRWPVTRVDYLVIASFIDENTNTRRSIRRELEAARALGEPRYVAGSCR